MKVGLYKINDRKEKINMEEVPTTITLIDHNGEFINYTLISDYYSDTEYNYRIVYTDHSINDKGDIRVYILTYDFMEILNVEYKDLTPDNWKGIMRRLPRLQETINSKTIEILLPYLQYEVECKRCIAHEQPKLNGVYICENKKITFGLDNSYCISSDNEIIHSGTYEYKTNPRAFVATDSKLSFLPFEDILYVTSTNDKKTHTTKWISECVQLCFLTDEYTFDFPIENMVDIQLENKTLKKKYKK